MFLRWTPAVALVSLALASDAIAPIATYTDVERRAWWLQKRSTPAVPSFQSAADRTWAKNPVDAFLLAKLRKEGLRPSRPADRRTLLRRVYFDLIGLPPTPAEVEEFFRASGPALAQEGGAEKQKERERIAYRAVVDRLLASAHYGERWARHWLDLAHV